MPMMILIQWVHRSFGDTVEVNLNTLYDAQKPLKEGFTKKPRPCQKLKNQLSNTLKFEFEKKKTTIKTKILPE